MMLTTKQVANRLAVHPATVRRLVKAGRIKAVLLSTSERARFRIDEKELQAFIDGGSVGQLDNEAIEQAISQYEGTGL